MAKKIPANIVCEIVDSVDVDAVERLYRAAGWWKSEFTTEFIPGIAGGSTCFVVAIDRGSGETIGMGRAVSDACSDAYIQDVTVLPEYRGRGVGSMIIKTIVDELLGRGLDWIALVGEPGTESFYRGLGFSPMRGHVPMLFSGWETHKSL